MDAALNPQSDQPVLLIDNYDSFVFNLSRYLQEWGAKTIVVRNDAVSIGEIRNLQPAAIVLSPGPGHPRDAGICPAVVRELGATIPQLGVCLGHQVIGDVFNGRIEKAEPVHGRTSLVQHDGTGLFGGCANPLRVTRYHSLVVNDETVDADVCVTARTDKGLVMGLAHRTWPVWGVQFHPESILSDAGHTLIGNFLRLAGFPVGAKYPAGDLPVVADEEDDDFFRRQIDPAVFRPW